ncbi:lysophospholipid acyltransferase family protein [Acidicapsa ligni]|uniref:lysophospholipid acyltransferase family protein n=1 Tax=Acidicapsa ligni TaxID=542300 RepID=UPI0021E03D0B|nr:lysophospholipid acyltransferase family protein [Acidicapsa ligni]
MTRTQVNPAHFVEELRKPSQRAIGLFSIYLRWYMRRHFYCVRVANAGRIPSQAQPLILFANHPSWWDPLTVMLLGQMLLPGREHYAPMDETSLKHYGIFRPMGFFAVDGATARGAAQLLRAGRQILSRAGSVLWITPEGQFQDVRKRPVIFKPGLGALMTRSGRLTCVPIAIEYVFWNERLPEIVVNIGEPLEIADGGMEDARTWTNLLSYAMSATLDELTMLAVERDPDAFEVMLSGSAGIGGIYELWKRFTCAVTGRPYHHDHGSLRKR